MITSWRSYAVPVVPSRVIVPLAGCVLLFVAENVAPVIRVPLILPEYTLPDRCTQTTIGTFVKYVLVTVPGT